MCEKYSEYLIFFGITRGQWMLALGIFIWTHLTDKVNSVTGWGGGKWGVCRCTFCQVLAAVPASQCIKPFHQNFAARSLLKRHGFNTIPAPFFQISWNVFFHYKFTFIISIYTSLSPTLLLNRFPRALTHTVVMFITLGKNCSPDSLPLACQKRVGGGYL